MRYAPLLLVLIGTLVVVGPARAEEPTPTRLEKAMSDPPATGLLIIQVVEGSQAAHAGIEAGSVLVTYDGSSTVSIPALRAAINGAAGQESVTLVVVHPGGDEATHTIAPGRIGVHLVPVRKGEKLDPLPADSGVRFDFARLAEGPRDDWYAFRLQNAGGKRGFEHGVTKLKDGKVVARREVAFDGGPQYGGVNHMDVTVTLTAEATPQLVSWRFDSPGSGYWLEGRLEVDEAGKRTLHVRRKPPDEEPSESSAEIEGDLPVLPSYVIETLAGFMPREEGASFHYLLLVDGNGQVSGEQALVGVGEETLDIDGVPTKAFKFEQQLLGGKAATFWVDADGHTVKSDYSGATATRTTKDAALKDLPEGIAPRSAD